MSSRAPSTVDTERNEADAIGEARISHLGKMVWHGRGSKEGECPHLQKREEKKICTWRIRSLISVTEKLNIRL